MAADKMQSGNTGSKNPGKTSFNGAKNVGAMNIRGGVKPHGCKTESSPRPLKSGNKGN